MIAVVLDVLAVAFFIGVPVIGLALVVIADYDSTRWTR